MQVIDQPIHRIMITYVLFWNKLFFCYDGMIGCIVVQMVLILWFYLYDLVRSWCYLIGSYSCLLFRMCNVYVD